MLKLHFATGRPLEHLEAQNSDPQMTQISADKHKAVNSEQ
jgi:hypothetical protein